MTCSCQRVQGTNGVVGSLFTGIGSMWRAASPYVLPTVVGIGTELLIGKLVPKPTSPALPAAVADPVATAQAERHESNVSTIVGVAVVAGVALYLLTKRRR